MGTVTKPQTAVMLAATLGFAVVLAGLAALLLYDVPLRFGLDCNRAAGRCVFTQILIRGARSGSLAIVTLERAEVRIASTAGRRGSPRVLLYVVAGPEWYYVADYSYWDREAAVADAALINEFLRDPSRARLDFQKREIVLYWVAWVALAGAVAVVAVLFRTVLRQAPGASGSR